VASGHGFKHGPVTSEMVDDAVLGATLPVLERRALSSEPPRAGVNSMFGL